MEHGNMSAFILKRFCALTLNFGGANVRLIGATYTYTARTPEPSASTLPPLHGVVKLGTKKMSSGVHPYEDAETLAQQKSKEFFNEWGKYWATVMNNGNDTEGIVSVTQGPSMDWKPLDDSTDTVNNTKKASSTTANGEGGDRRWIFALRHGERVDLTYGAWAEHCFDARGQYMRRDLNMPLTLGKRVGGKESYARDTPLTRVGRLQAELVGEGLRLAGVPVRHVFASAALRCVETAHHLLQGLQGNPSVEIKVEPGLFEYKLWHLAKGMAPFMTPLELRLAGYNVDLDYKPYVEVDTVSNETLEEFYQRNEKVMQSALRDTEADGGNIIFVGHAATLDTMVIAMNRLRDGHSGPAGYQVSKNLLRVPYCALGAMRANPLQLVPPPCPPSINSSSGRFNWKMLQDL